MKGCLRLVSLGLVIAIVAMIWNAEPREDRPGAPAVSAPAAEPARPRPPAARSPRPGDTVALAAPRAGFPTQLARTWDDFEEMMTVAGAGDEVGFNQLLASGRIVELPPGTRAKVLEIHFTVDRVRVIDGPNSGVDGWVAKEFVHAVPEGEGGTSGGD